MPLATTSENDVDSDDDDDDDAMTQRRSLTSSYTTTEGRYLLTKTLTTRDDLMDIEDHHRISAFGKSTVNGAKNVHV